MSEKNTFFTWLSENFEDACSFIIKSGAWLWYSIVGVLGKWSYSIMSGKKMSFMQYVASAGVALYVGYIASNFCIKYYPEGISFIVPVCVLSSDKIIVALMGLNWRKIIDNAIAVYKGSKDTKSKP